MANDNIVDYSALVGDMFAYNEAYVAGGYTANPDGSFSITTTSYEYPGTYYKVTGWSDGASNGLGYDTITLQHVNADGTAVSGSIYNGTVEVLGHNAGQIVVRWPAEGSPAWAQEYYLTLDDDAIGVGTTITADPNSTAAPLGTTVVCFAEGTRIATAAGERAVEDLAEGDLVLTASGEERVIKWVGQMIVRPSRHPHPWEVNPVVVRAGAFGEGAPARDVRLSPGHAVYVEGVLIPVGQLVNGATIVQEEVDEIRYFHIELDSHDVLMAEGLPCESYLDDGNRSSFANADGVTVLNGRLDPKSWDEACAPMVAAGPQLEEVQRRLIARAEELGWAKVEEPNLCLVADGAVVEPMRTAGERAWFLVPACAELTLASNAAVVAQLMPGVTDQRRLGVAVSEVKVDGEALDLANRAAFRKGFYKLETHEDAAWRWTNGEGRLAVSLTEPAVVEVRLHMAAPAWKRAASQLKLAQVA